MTITKGEFREAMSRLGAAVNVITTDGPHGLYGLTVSAVASITDDPATMLVCLNRESRANAVVKANGVLCVNILGACHGSLSMLFARSAASVADRFGDMADWDRMTSGCPALRNATASLDCTIESVVEAGTHSMFLCRVVEARFGDACEGLVYFNRRFHGVGDLTAQ